VAHAGSARYYAKVSSIACEVVSYPYRGWRVNRKIELPDKAQMSVIHSKIRYEEFPRERGSPIVSAGIYEDFAKKLADNDRPMFKGGYKLEENFVEKDQA
jgi:hypothetical protein